MRWFEQQGAEGFAYAICARLDPRRHGELDNCWLSRSQQAMKVEIRLPWHNSASKAPSMRATSRFLSTTHSGGSGSGNAHCVQLADPTILRHYYLVRYFYGAASRRGAPPIPLQGVWVGRCRLATPPWKGDYHKRPQYISGISQPPATSKRGSVSWITCGTGCQFFVNLPKSSTKRQALRCLES